jgi:2-(acetamidomethylene)succinate hydrolase
MPNEAVRERWYDLGQLGLFGLEAGDGQLTVLLHGITAHAYVWYPIIELLAPSLRVVAVDQRGHGRSDRPPGAGYGHQELSEDVARLIDVLDHGPAIVVGHSLGARNALVAAARHPDRVAGVVAIEFTPFIEDGPLDALEQRVAAGAGQKFPDFAAVWAYLRERYARLPQDAVQRRAEHGYAPAEKGGFRPLADAQAMVETCRGLRVDLEPAVRHVRRPTLLVRGEDSALVSREAFERTRALRPDLAALTVADTDHYVPEEKPAEVAEIVRNFAFGTADRSESS